MITPTGGEGGVFWLLPAGEVGLRELSFFSSRGGGWWKWGGGGSSKITD